MNYSSSSMLKREAKEQIFSNLGTVIGAFLVSFAITRYAPNLFPIPTNNLAGYGILLLFSIFISLIASIFMQGECMICLKLACNQEIAVKDVFYGFKNGQIPKIIGLRIIPCVVVELVTIPVTFMQQYFLQVIEEIGLLGENAGSLSSLLVNPVQGADGVAESLSALSEKVARLIPVEMAYLGVLVIQVAVMIVMEIMFSQVLFLSLDFPDKSVKETIMLGRKIMKGNWGRFFRLQLSFIPWHLLAAVTMGIAYIWVLPYVRATYTNFYLDLMKNQKKG